MSAQMNMTPARLALLYAVERGQVLHRPSFASYEAYDVWIRSDGSQRTVTAAMRSLVSLVRRPPDPLRSRPWELTDAGRVALAEAGEQS